MELRELMNSYFNWLKRTYTSNSSTTPRSWCLLDMEGPINQQTIADHFERDDLNDEFVEKFNDLDPVTKQPHSYVQAEIDQIYAFQKSFTARHKTRLQAYRDDCAQKNYHTWNTLAMGYGRFMGEKNNADKEGHEV